MSRSKTHKGWRIIFEHGSHRVMQSAQTCKMFGTGALDRSPFLGDCIRWIDEADTGLALNRLATDERTIAERQWAAPIRAAKPQQPCDHGMFGDEKDQLDLCEMFQEPTNE